MIKHCLKADRGENKRGTSLHNKSQTQLVLFADKGTYMWTQKGQEKAQQEQFTQTGHTVFNPKATLYLLQTRAELC